MTVASLQELIAQKESLEREIEETKNRDRSEAISKVRTLMEEYGLSADDVTLKRSVKSTAAKSTGQTTGKANGAGTKVAAKYRNVDTGETWSGRGLQPKWLKAAVAGGRNLTDFSV